MTVHVRGQANFEHCHEPDEHVLKEKSLLIVIPREKKIYNLTIHYSQW